MRISDWISDVCSSDLLAVILEYFDQANIGWKGACPAGLRNGKAKRLQAVILQHNRRYRIRHRIQQCVAIFETESSLAHVLVERDLDIDLIVGTIDARTIVDEVRVDPPAVQCVGDAPCLRNAQIGSLDRKSTRLNSRH